MTIEPILTEIWRAFWLISWVTVSVAVGLALLAGMMATIMCGGKYVYRYFNWAYKEAIKPHFTAEIKEIGKKVKP